MGLMNGNNLTRWCDVFGDSKVGLCRDGLLLSQCLPGSQGYNTQFNIGPSGHLEVALIDW